LRNFYFKKTLWVMCKYVFYPNNIPSQYHLFVYWPCPKPEDIVFRFIIEYSSLRDFGPQVIGLFLYEHFRKMICWLGLKLEISYRVIISWRILVSFRFLHGKILEFP
jgi:hypothetical protein